jgi:hypothetical protein
MLSPPANERGERALAGKTTRTELNSWTILSEEGQTMREQKPWNSDEYLEDLMVNCVRSCLLLLDYLS